MHDSFPQRLARFLCLLLSITSCLSSSTTKPVVLRPIHNADYERSFGLQSRNANPFHKLDLQEQGQLTYGSPQGMRVSLPEKGRRVGVD